MPTALYMHYCALVYNVVLGRLRFSQIYFDIFWIDWGHLIVIYIYIFKERPKSDVKIRMDDLEYHYSKTVSFFHIKIYHVYIYDV